MLTEYIRCPSINNSTNENIFKHNFLNKKIKVKDYSFIKSPLQAAICGTSVASQHLFHKISGIKLSSAMHVNFNFNTK